MSQMPTIHLLQPIARARVVPETQGRTGNSPGGSVKAEDLADGFATGTGEPSAGSHLPLPPFGAATPRDPDLALQQQKAELARLVATLNRLADSLGKVYEETLACNHGQIARLAVEIARKILMYKVDKGDYAIQALVEEAIKQAPTRQKVVVRLNPADLAGCQRLQREDPHSPFAELELAADGSLGRAECLVQTPKGIVTSFLEQHLERIREALQKVE